MISSGRAASKAARNAGISSGSCWPSASRVTTASRAAVEGVPEAATQRGALAGVRDLAQDGRTGRLGDRGRVVGRAVVDDDDRQVLAGGRDDRPIRGPSSNAGMSARIAARSASVIVGKYRAHSGRPVLMTDSGTTRHGGRQSIASSAGRVTEVPRCHQPPIATTRPDAHDDRRTARPAPRGAAAQARRRRAGAPPSRAPPSPARGGLLGRAPADPSKLRVGRRRRCRRRTRGRGGRDVLRRVPGPRATTTLPGAAGHRPGYRPDPDPALDPARRRRWTSAGSADRAVARDHDHRPSTARTSRSRPTTAGRGRSPSPTTSS